MKHRIVSFILLVFFRVFLIPVWFSWHIDEIKDAGETYEHIRLKKRRTSYLEENITVCELTHNQAVFSAPWQRLLSFRLAPAAACSPSPDTSDLSPLAVSYIVLPLYLRNRMLRI